MRHYKQYFASYYNKNTKEIIAIREEVKKSIREYKSGHGYYDTAKTVRNYDVVDAVEELELKLAALNNELMSRKDSEKIIAYFTDETLNDKLRNFELIHNNLTTLNTSYDRLTQCREFTDMLAYIKERVESVNEELRRREEEKKK